MKIEFNANSFKELKGQCCHSSVFPTMCVALLQFIQEIISIGFRMRIGLQYPSLMILNLAKSSNKTAKTNAPHMSQQVWHDKDPSRLLRGHGRRYQPITFIWMKYFRVWHKTVFSQSIQRETFICERREVFWRALPRTMTLDNASSHHDLGHVRCRDRILKPCTFLSPKFYAILNFLIWTPGTIHSLID